MTTRLLDRLRHGGVVLKAWCRRARPTIAWLPWLAAALMLVAAFSPAQMAASHSLFQTPPPSTTTPQPVTPKAGPAPGTASPQPVSPAPTLTAVSIPHYEQLISQLLRFIPTLIAAIVIFFAFWIIAVIVSRIIRRVWLERTKDPDVVRLLEQTARVSILTFGAVTALGTVGINILALVAGLGLTGFALGFAFKDALSNYLSGILLIIYKPFTYHDEISVSGQHGVVTDINLRYTVLVNDEQTILIPNSQLFSNVVIIQARKISDKGSQADESTTAGTSNPQPDE
jgi:small conductance mechanosensitive channel